MLNRDVRWASMETRVNRAKNVRSRSAKIGVEGLEERSLLSGAGVRASIIDAHNALLAERAHRLQLRADFLAARHNGSTTPLATNTATIQSPSVASAAVTKSLTPVRPAAAS